MGVPKHNSDYWTDKFVKNVERDIMSYAELDSEGWAVVVIWECEIKSNLDEAIGRIIDAIDGRR